MKICPNCKNSVEDDIKLCPNCNTFIADAQIMSQQEINKVENDIKKIMIILMENMLVSL